MDDAGEVAVDEAASNTAGNDDVKGPIAGPTASCAVGHPAWFPHSWLIICWAKCKNRALRHGKSVFVSVHHAKHTIELLLDLMLSSFETRDFLGGSTDLARNIF